MAHYSAPGIRARFLLAMKGKARKQHAAVPTMVQRCLRALPPTVQAHHQFSVVRPGDSLARTVSVETPLQMNGVGVGSPAVAGTMRLCTMGLDLPKTTQRRTADGAIDTCSQLSCPLREPRGDSDCAPRRLPGQRASCRWRGSSSELNLLTSMFI